MTKLHTAVSENNWGKIRNLLKEGVNPNAQDAHGQTSLHIAAAKGCTEIVNTLLHYQADPNARDGHGQTALHIAAAKGCTEMVNTLLRNRKKAEVNAQDNHNRTPLHEAAIANHLWVVSSLLAHGADVSIRDKDGNTAGQMTQSSEIKRAISTARNKAATNTQEKSLITSEAEGVSIEESPIPEEATLASSGATPLVPMDTIFSRGFAFFSTNSNKKENSRRFDGYKVLSPSLEKRKRVFQPISSTVSEDEQEKSASASSTSSDYAASEAGDDLFNLTAIEHVERPSADALKDVKSTLHMVSLVKEADKKAKASLLEGQLNKPYTLQFNAYEPLTLDAISRRSSFESDTSLDSELTQEIDSPILKKCIYNRAYVKKGELATSNDSLDSIRNAQADPEIMEERDGVLPLNLPSQAETQIKHDSWLNITALSLRVETNVQDCLEQAKEAVQKQTNPGGLEVLDQTQRSGSNKLIVLAQLKNSSTTEAQAEDRYSLLEMTQQGDQEIWRQQDQQNLSMQEQELIRAGVLLQRAKGYLSPTVTIGKDMPVEKQTWLYCYLDAFKKTLGCSLRIVCQTPMLEEIKREFSEKVQPQFAQIWDQLSNSSKDSALFLNDCINTLLAKDSSTDALSDEENHALHTYRSPGMKC